MFYAPGSLDITSADAQAFVRGRRTWLSASEELADVPILQVTEAPLIPDQGIHRRNLSFYSYFFYLDDETRRSLYRTLARMQPKAALAELAREVAVDLGTFNAVHLRRGDFKVTYGVTTLDRHPWEAIEAMDHHFRRDDPLVILTDERDDPFFDEIKATYKRHVFIDHHILDAHGDCFDQLPGRDAIALAYLSQLVAAESQDFIGTMTSTFTAIVQRYRGNRGHEEPFKFFWNEIPDPGDAIERGRHPISECVPLDRGVMLEEHEGRYSWNRYSQRILPAWMREWPESFLTEPVLETGALPDDPRATAAPARHAGPISQISPSRLYVPFDGVRVAIRPNASSLAHELREAFHLRADAAPTDVAPTNVVAELEVTPPNRNEAAMHRTVMLDGQDVDRGTTNLELIRAIQRQLVPLFNRARPRHTWLEASAFCRDGQALVVAGDVRAGGQGNADSLADALCASGWDLLADGVIPIDPENGQVLPFGRNTLPRGASRPGPADAMPVGALVLAAHRLPMRDAIAALEPSVAVAELVAFCLDFRHDRERAVRRLCQLVEGRLIEGHAVYQLSFSQAARGARLLAGLEAWTPDRTPEEATS